MVGAGVAKSVWATRPGFEYWRVMEIFLFATGSTLALGPIHPPVHWVWGALSPGVKRPGREAGHSPPASAEAKNAWSYTYTLPYVFMALCLVKYRDSFTRTFTIVLQVTDFKTWVICVCVCNK